MSHSVDGKGCLAVYQINMKVILISIRKKITIAFLTHEDIVYTRMLKILSIPEC